MGGSGGGAGGMGSGGGGSAYGGHGAGVLAGGGATLGFGGSGTGASAGLRGPSSGLQMPPRFAVAAQPLAITNSSPAGAKGSPVLLCNGLLNFQIPLLSSMAAGTGSFSFALDYVAGGTGTTSSDGTVGLNFNYPQNAVLIQSGSNVILQLGENTQELFNYVSPGVYSSSANNSRTLMTRTASGTSADQFTLVSGDGVVSIFSGFYSSITTPGRLKTMTDRFGNSMGFTWQLVGGLARLTSVTDSYGRHELSHLFRLGKPAPAGHRLLGPPGESPV